MIKVEVIEKFTLKDFDELKNIERKSIDTKGVLYVGDTFECSKEMVDYLTGKNPLNKAVVKVIEVEPEKEETKELNMEKEIEKTIEKIETKIEEMPVKPKKKKKK